MEASIQYITNKIEAAKRLFIRLPAAGVDIRVSQELIGEIGAIHIRFALATTPFVVTAKGGQAKLQQARDGFARALATGDFAGEIDRMVLRGEAALRAAGVVLRDDAEAARPTKKGRGRPALAAPPGARRPGTGAKPGPPPEVCAELQGLLDFYPRIPGPYGDVPTAQQVDCDSCPSCGGRMAVDPGRSELLCGDCGVVQKLEGVVFDEAQFYSQEGQKAKSGTFNPNRHFQFWWTHILAREPEEELGDKDDPDNQYGEKLLESLQKLIKRDRRIILQRLSVNDIRNMLRDREVNRTDLNKNVPLILKKLTGIGPPQLSEAIAARVENLFSKAIEIGERVRRVGRVNRNYYPYYIFKILDALLDENDPEMAENRRVLYYIYIQSRETVEADDADWEQICQELKEITFTPTDRTKAQQYYPV